MVKGFNGGIGRRWERMEREEMGTRVEEAIEGMRVKVCGFRAMERRGLSPNRLYTGKPMRYISFMT